MRGMLADVAPGRSLVDELIAERRAEARAEDRAREQDEGAGPTRTARTPS